LRFLISVALTALIAAAIGVATAWYAVAHGDRLTMVTSGPWTASPDAGAPDANPYAIAHLSLAPELPLGPGEGIAYTAATDSSGAPLVGRCTYALSGETPAARVWTLAAYDAAGNPMPNAAGRAGLTSRDLLRRADGTFVILLARDVQPENWLPVETDGAFSLVLRAYDTPVTANGQALIEALPALERQACR
jgi:hypothetical protein